jgi:DNA-binding LytR/AlgR family response regulator
LKPVTYERFSQTIRRLNSKEKVGCNNDQYLFIKGNKKNVWQRLEPVGTLYIESSHNYSIIHSENLTKQTVYLNLAEIEDALSPYKFLRIQKSFIINVKRISKIEGSSIFLQGMDTPLTCGRNFRPALMAAIDSRILSRKDNLTDVSRH